MNYLRIGAWLAFAFAIPYGYSLGGVKGALYGALAVPVAGLAGLVALAIFLSIVGHIVEFVAWMFGYEL